MGAPDSRQNGAFRRLEVALSEGSSVLNSNLKLDSTVDLTEAVEGDRELVEAVRRRWGAVTSFSSIKQANRISLLLPEGEERADDSFHFFEPFDPVSVAHADIRHSTCLPISPPTVPSGDFDYVNSYLVGKVESYGCHHSELAGQASCDVHILDLESADGMASSPSDPAPVYLSLAPEVDTPLERNVTLLLSSREPVLWMLQSRSLSGRLRVLFAGPAGSRS